MSEKTPKFAVIGGSKQISQNVGVVESPNVPPLIGFDTSERRVWKYICDSLKDAGVEHITAGLPIALIVRTYSDWIAAAEICRQKGRTQTSSNGWSSEAPWAADERRLKSELSQWLPKACLTIPSLTKVKKDLGVVEGQDDLFTSLASHAAQKPKIA